jgi:hypothetical protein
VADGTAECVCYIDIMAVSSQHVENILATFDRAADANRRTPGRRGATVVLTSELAGEVMVTGDVHGHRENFDAICRIAALDDHPRRHLVLQEVCHGGPSYPKAAGCMSHAVLEDAAAMKARYPERVHFILGNHELAELSDYPIQKNRQLLNLQFRQGLQQTYGPAAEEVRRAYLRFLWTCPLAVRLPQGVFIAHSLPEGVDRRGFDPSVLGRELNPDDCREDAEVFRLVWGRDYRRANAQAFLKLVGAKILVTGHEPCSGGFTAPNNLQIILDCCGNTAAYVILPVGVELSHAEILKRVTIFGEWKMTPPTD